MKKLIIGFDLQGTLTDTAFSDEFWQHTLPLLYSKRKGILLSEAKLLLKAKFKQIGRYDYRYYDYQYWNNKLHLNTTLVSAMKLVQENPNFYQDWLPLLKKLKKHYHLIIISSTSHAFISKELGEKRKYFDAVFSALDNFGIAGKPKKLYKKICKKIGIQPTQIVYVGNDLEMDIQNANDAGLKTFYFNPTVCRSILYRKLLEYIKF
jgi:HAD superfamily hydrolase (TIGR01549 family)